MASKKHTISKEALAMYRDRGDVTDPIYRKQKMTWQVIYMKAKNGQIPKSKHQRDTVWNDHMGMTYITDQIFMSTRPGLIELQLDENGKQLRAEGGNKTEYIILFLSGALKMHKDTPPIQIGNKKFDIAGLNFIEIEEQFPEVASHIYNRECDMYEFYAIHDKHSAARFEHCANQKPISGKHLLRVVSGPTLDRLRTIDRITLALGRDNVTTYATLMYQYRERGWKVHVGNIPKVDELRELASLDISDSKSIFIFDAMTLLANSIDGWKKWMLKETLNKKKKSRGKKPTEDSFCFYTRKGKGLDVYQATIFVQALIRWLEENIVSDKKNSIPPKILNSIIETLKQYKKDGKFGNGSTDPDARTRKEDCDDTHDLLKKILAPIALDRRRAFLASQKTAVELRSGGKCEVEGCCRPAQEFHHIKEWSAGGRTEVDNCLHVCSEHHTELTSEYNSKKKSKKTKTESSEKQKEIGLTYDDEPATIGA